MSSPKCVEKVLIALLEAEAYQATKYLSDREVVTVTKRRYRSRRKQYSKRDRILDLVLKIGQPNYRERQFIAACKKSGEPFPVKKIQLRPFPERRA